MSKRHPRYGMIVSIPIALDASARDVSVANLEHLVGTPLSANEHEPA